jgi:hypothetical protein
VQCPAGSNLVRNEYGEFMGCFVPSIGGGAGAAGGSLREPVTQDPQGPPGAEDDPWEVARETAFQNAMVRLGANGRFASEEQRRTMAQILATVSQALLRPDCGGLFGDSGAALRQLAVASFSYAANAHGIDGLGVDNVAEIATLGTNPGNTVATAFINTNIGFVNDNFFNSFSNSLSRGATNIIHELMHMAGFGTATNPGRGDIDTNLRDGNYADISRKWEQKTL